MMKILNYFLMNLIFNSWEIPYERQNPHMKYELIRMHFIASVLEFWVLNKQKTITIEVSFKTLTKVFKALFV